MTREDGTYVYAAPFPDVTVKGYPNFITSEGIKIPPCPEIAVSKETVHTTTITIPFSSPILDDLQMQMEELTRQNDIFMEALTYCISKFSKEEIKNDLRLGLIEMASKLR